MLLFGFFIVEVKTKPLLQAAASSVGRAIDRKLRSFGAAGPPGSWRRFRFSRRGHRATATSVRPRRRPADQAAATGGSARGGPAVAALAAAAEAVEVAAGGPIRGFLG